MTNKQQLDNKVKFNINSATIILWILTVLYFIAIPIIKNESFTRMIWIPISLLLLFICFTSLDFMKVKEIWYIVLISFLCIFSIFIYRIFDFTSIYPIYAFLIQMLVCCIFSKLSISKKIFDFIFFANIVITLLLLAYSFTSFAYKGFMLSLGFSNPNATAMYIYCVFCILLLNVKSRKRKVLIYLLIGVLMWLTYKTTSRSCFFTEIIILVFYFFFYNKKIPIFISRLIALFPLIFYFLYMSVYDIAGLDFTIMNKHIFSGRQYVYKEHLSHINSFSQKLFGNLKEELFSNAHNGPLAVYCSIGIIGIVLTYLIYLNMVDEVTKKTKQNSITALVCILGIFIQASAESALFIGGMPGVVFIATILLISNYESDDKKPPKEGKQQI